MSQVTTIKITVDAKQQIDDLFPDLKQYHLVNVLLAGWFMLSDRQRQRALHDVTTPASPSPGPHLEETTARPLAEQAKEGE